MLVDERFADAARRRLVAGFDPSAVVAALGRAAGEGERCAEMPPSRRAITPAQFEFSERRRKKWISGEAFGPIDCTNFLNASLRSVFLGYGDRPVERHNRAGTDSHQHVVKPHDLRPVRVL